VQTSADVTVVLDRPKKTVPVVNFANASTPYGGV